LEKARARNLLSRMRRAVVGLALGLSFIGLISVFTAGQASAASDLGPGGVLGPNQNLSSPNGSYVLSMQGDGNVVLYAPGHIATWSSRTFVRDSVLMMQNDGNLVIRAPGNVPVFSTGTNGNGGTILRVQDDGNVVLYAPGNRAIWWTNSQFEAAISYAYAQLGKPYCWGGNGPTCFDCSGLTKAAYGSAGISLPRNSNDQWNVGAPVGRDRLRRGDLVFFYTATGHVGIYIGNGKMINARNSKLGIRIDSIDALPWRGAKRVA
jgi:NlpC/P60 family